MGGGGGGGVVLCCVCKMCHNLFIALNVFIYIRWVLCCVFVFIVPVKCGGGGGLLWYDLKYLNMVGGGGSF